MGKDCNGSMWKIVLVFYQDVGGCVRLLMFMIGYYLGDKGCCDVMIGDGVVSNGWLIQDIVKDLVNYIDCEYISKGWLVDIIGYLMGGLIVRVVLLGLVQGWDGFLSKWFKVGNVVMFSMLYQGVVSLFVYCDEQWCQMVFGLGFIM